MFVVIQYKKVIKGIIMFFLKSGGQKFVDRGDPQFNDFDTGDFTKDNAWYELDLSSIVPGGTSLVLLRVRIMSDNASADFSLRKKGNTYTTNKAHVSPGVTMQSVEYDCHVSVDADGKCEYKCSSHTFQVLNVAVRGWFK